jgi:Putative DNA-binding domain
MLRSLSEVQAEFAAALVDPATRLPEGVRGPNGRPAPRRFAVYRNNVIVGLVGAVAGAFPAVKRIVGDDFFNAMARAYVSAEPPTSPVLMDYGTRFADFIATFEPAASLPYLADVARIERAWHEAYHAAEADSLGAADLAGIGEAELPALTFVLHPSLRIVRSAYPALTIWRMNTRDGPIAPVDLHAGGEDALIVRPEAIVDVRLLPAGGASFIGILSAGGSLCEAAARGAESDDFDLSASIAGLIGSGSVVSYSVGH